MKKFTILIVALVICMLFVSSAYAVNVANVNPKNYNVGDNVSGIIPMPTKPIFPFSAEQKSTALVLGGDLDVMAENASTSIVEMWFVNPSSVLLADFTASEQWQYVNEGDELQAIFVFVNVSKAYVGDWDEARNNTAVWISFMPLAEDPIIEGYFYQPALAVYEYADAYQVVFSSYTPYTFETGLYLISLEYYVFY